MSLLRDGRWQESAMGIEAVSFAFVGFEGSTRMCADQDGRSGYPRMSLKIVQSSGRAGI